MRTPIPLLSLIAISTAGAPAQDEPVPPGARIQREKPVELAWWIEVGGPAPGRFAPGRTAKPGWLLRADGGAARRLDDVRPARREVSPDGGRVAYTEDVDGGREVFVAKLGGADPRRLTDEPGDDTDPVFTADGKSVVFLSRRERFQALWRVPAAGGEPVRLTGEAFQVRGAYPSPDRATIAYRRTQPYSTARGDKRPPPTDLVLLDPIGGEKRVLLEDDAHFGVAWTDDGRRLAVGVDGAVLVLDVDSGERLARIGHRAIDERLFAHGAHHLCWRPDGKAFAARLHFLGGREKGTEVFGDRQVFVVPLQGEATTIELPSEGVDEPWDSARPVAWLRLPR